MTMASIWSFSNTHFVACWHVYWGKWDESNKNTTHEKNEKNGKARSSKLDPPKSFMLTYNFDTIFILYQKFLYSWYFSP